MKKRLFIILCLVEIATMAFAQEWTAIGPLSGKFSTIEWSLHNEDIIYAATDYTIFKSEDHGITWDVLFSFGIEGFNLMIIHNLTMDTTDENTIFINAEITYDQSLPQNGIYKSTDGGVTFEQIHQAPTKGFIIHPTTEKIVSYKNGDDGNFYASTDGGSNFTQYTNIPNRLQELSFDPIDDDIIYATTYYGVYKTVDGGTNWDLIGFEDENILMCASHPVNSGEVWVGSPFFGDEFIYKTVDGGDNWNLVDLPYTESVADHPKQMIWGNDSDKIYITEMNEVFVSNDNGINWTTTSFDIETEFFYPLDLALNPFNDDELIIPSDLKAIQTADGGDTYTNFAITAGICEVIETVENPAGGYYVYAGNPSGLNRYSTEEESWEDFTEPGLIGVGIKALSTNPAQPNFVLKGVRNALNNALLYKSTDFGNTFNLVWDNLSDYGGFTTEIERSFSEEGVFYLTTWNEGIPAQLVRSEDYGDTWTIIDENDANHNTMTDVVISYQNPDIIFTFGDGVITKSTDRGETWTDMYNGVPYEGVYDGAIDPYNDNHLYVSVTSGIFETIDGGETWTNVSIESAKKIEFNPILPGMVTAVTFNHDVLISFDYGINWESYLGDIQSASFTDVTYSPDGTTLLVGTTSQGIYSTPLDASYIIPQNLTASVTNFNVNLNWDQVSGVNSYAIYQNGIKIDETETNFYTDYYLIPGEYEYKVASILNGIESELSNTVFAYIGGSDLAVPTNLYAEITDFRDITLSWEEPTLTPQTGWFAYDNGETAGTYSNMIGGNYDVCIKFTPEDLADYDGFLLSQIKFIPTASYHIYSLKVYSGENGVNLEIDQSINSVTENEWNFIDLETPYTIDASQPLYFGYYVESFGMIGTYDAGPAVASGKCDLLGSWGNWTTLADYGVDANWNIQGLVESPTQREDRITLQHHLTRDMTGFKIYKEGTLLEEVSDPAQFSYTDADNEFATYHYAVTANYNEGESVPSNEEIVDLINPFLTPTNLAYSVENENNVNLNWQAPVFSDLEVDLQYSSGIEGGIYNAFVGGNLDVAVRFSTADLADYVGLNLNSISFKPVNEFGTYTLKVWTGENYDEAVSQEITEFNLNEINEFMLETPFEIVADQDIWFGYNINYYMGGDLFAYDNDPVINSGYSDLIGSNGSWMTLTDLGIEANNLLTATVIGETNHPVITRYKIYKNGAEIAEVDGEETLTYINENVEFDTTLQYAVSTLYQNDEESILSDIVEVYIENPYLAPLNLTGTVQENQITLQWEMAEDIYTMHWDDGTNTDGVGATGGGAIQAAIRFAPEHLQDVNDFELRRVRFFPREDYPTTIKIYTGELAETLIYEQPVEGLVAMQWNEVTLETPVTISSDDWFWISYEMVNTQPGFYPLGVDNGPAVEALGDLISLDGGENWLLLSSNGFNANNNIQGEVVDNQGRVVELNLSNPYIPVNSDSFIVDPSLLATTGLSTRDREVELIGFNIYRDDELLMEITDPTIRIYYDDVQESGDYSYKISALYDPNIESAVSDIVEVSINIVGNDESQIPAVTALTGNYPNPFNPTTSINYSINQNGKVKLEIYNIKGQKVKTLVNANQEAGYHSVNWSGKDNNSKKVASGIYFYRMQTDNYNSTQKMILMK